jgi:hypothetical protein
LLAASSTPPFSPQAIVKISTGADQTGELQTAYDGASDGDTIVLRPGNGKPFVISADIHWDGARAVNIEAVGSRISGGTCAVYWGAPAGRRAGGLNLRGGYFDCHLILHNLGYSRIEPQSISGGLEFIADDGQAAPYNLISATGGIAGSPAIRVTETGSGWVNAITFYATHLDSRGGQPLIVQTNKNGYGLGLFLYDHCCLETPSALYDCGIVRQQIWRECYWEPAGQFTLGKIDPISRVTFVRPNDGLTFLGDNRVRMEGNLQ